MGKKVKRAVTAVATGGLSETARGISSAANKVMEQITPETPEFGPDQAALDAARRQENLAKNRQADLTLENIADIAPGGTAGSGAGGISRRRRRAGQSVATSLGINR